MEQCGKAQQPAVNTFVKQLLQCKKQLDRKVDKAFDTLKQTTAAIEGYQEHYSSTIERLCEEVRTVPLPEADTMSQIENTMSMMQADK